MPLKRKLGPANPPTTTKRLQMSLPSIVLMCLFVAFAIASFVTPPTRGIPIAEFWERSLYVELLFAGLLGLFGIITNLYWPTKVAYGVGAIVFALLTVYLTADPSFSVRGRLYPALLSMFSVAMYVATKPYTRSYANQHKHLNRVLEEFREDPTRPDGERG